MYTNKLFQAALSVSTLLGLAGCGHAIAPAAVKTPASVHVSDAFAPTTLAELSAHADDPAYDRRLVSVEASFERYDYSLEYGRTYHGYRLWDRANHWLLCQNVYRVGSVYPGAAVDASRDLAAGPAARLLAFGTFVPVQGMFHLKAAGASHGGVYVVPASLDLYTIDGQATHLLVNQ